MTAEDFSPWDSGRNVVPRTNPPQIGLNCVIVPVVSLGAEFFREINPGCVGTVGPWLHQNLDGFRLPVCRYGQFRHVEVGLLWWSNQLGVRIRLLKLRKFFCDRAQEDWP